jgi:hypothetical protein
MTAPPVPGVDGTPVRKSWRIVTVSVTIRHDFGSGLIR